MQLTCTIDQPEAIRRGFNTNSTVKLEIDPATLTQGEREILALHFENGEFKYGSIRPPIPEPTLKGLIEKIAEMATAKAIQREKDAQAEAKAIATANEQFAARSARETTELVYAWTASDGTHHTGTLRESPYAAVTGSATYPCLDARGPSYPTAAENEWDRLLATPEGIAWTASLEATNTAARNKAALEAIENLKQTLAANLEKKQRKEAAENQLRQWALTHGSETLRLRTEEGFSWKELAAEEWADALIAKAGITHPMLETPDGYSPDGENAQEPTISQIQSLREIRDLLAATAADTPHKTCLTDITYTEDTDEDEYPGDDPDVIHRTEVQVDITCPTGVTVTRYFQA